MTLDAKEHRDKTLLAIKLCAEDSEKRGFVKGKHGASGVVVCPACGKRLAYTRASSNGHIWGGCEDPECLSWVM